MTATEGRGIAYFNAINDVEALFALLDSIGEKQFESRLPAAKASVEALKEAIARSTKDGDPIRVIVRQTMVEAHRDGMLSDGAVKMILDETEDEDGKDALERWLDHAAAHCVAAVNRATGT